MTNEERIERLERIVEFLASQMYPTQTVDTLINNNMARHFKPILRTDEGPIGNNAME